MLHLAERQVCLRSIYFLSTSTTHAFWQTIETILPLCNGTCLQHSCTQWNIDLSYITPTHTLRAFPMTGMVQKTLVCAEKRSAYSPPFSWGQGGERGFEGGRQEVRSLSGFSQELPGLLRTKRLEARPKTTWLESFCNVPQSTFSSKVVHIKHINWNHSWAGGVGGPTCYFYCPRSKSFLAGTDPDYAGLHMLEY